uniref:Uncharacterized protein n=1 Tax=Castor canadensis TaxID=51338 RepID=A0A8C0VV35_CASCN
MLGVNVAKSSLHLHFLKTLEFRTDVSVISMAGVAEAIRLHKGPSLLPGKCNLRSHPVVMRAKQEPNSGFSELVQVTVLRGAF